MDSLGDFLGQNLKEQKARIETQGLEPGIISSYFVFGNYRFKIRVTRVLIEKQNLGGDSLIWGNSAFGTWGSYKWGDQATYGFVLGHPLAGVLGTSKLGSNLSSYETVEEIILTQVIPTVAREEVAKFLAGESATSPTHMALGTDDTAFSESDTSLGNEIARKTITCDLSEDKTVKYQIEILSTDTEFITGNPEFKEIGLFNSDTGGTLFTRAISSGFTHSQTENTRITITHYIDDDSVGNSTITLSGLNGIRDWLGGSSSVYPQYIAWGTGTTDVSESDTALEGEIERNALIKTTRNGAIITYEGILDRTEGNGNDITKSGLFDQSSGGTLIAESKFGEISKTSFFQVYETDKITIT